MENQQLKLDKAVKISIILGVFIVALSVAYYFIYRPIQKQNISKKCYAESQNLFENQYTKKNIFNENKFKECLTKNGL